jgi:hypothetical protein
LASGSIWDLVGFKEYDIRGPASAGRSSILGFATEYDILTALMVAQNLQTLQSLSNL